MNDRSSKDRLYAAVLLTFLVGLVVLGLLGVPALLVAAIGLVVAAVGIALFHRVLGRGGGLTSRGRRRGQKVPDRYVPSVLEGSRVKRRRLGPLRRHRHASPPLRFR